MKPYEKLISKTYVKVGKVEFPFYELYEMMSDLSECDGYFTFINISNHALKEELEKREVIRTNIRGSCHKGKNFSSFRKEVGLIMDGIYAKRNKDRKKKENKGVK